MFTTKKYVIKERNKKSGLFYILTYKTPEVLINNYAPKESKIVFRKIYLKCDAARIMGHSNTYKIALNPTSKYKEFKEIPTSIKGSEFINPYTKKEYE